MSEMLERTSFDTPILPRLGTIIAEIQRGVYQIPDFQRPYVWADDQRLELLDSIVKGLPIGSLLVWRSSSHRLGTYPEIAGIPLPPPQSEGNKHTYLIDGHQRISTLFGALVRPLEARTGKDARRWPIYYELGTSESPAFRVPPSRGDVPNHWLPLDILLDNRAVYRFRDRLFQAKEEEKADEVERLANVFKDYIIPIVPLVTENLDLVTDAFVRINSKGSDMTEAHMLRALTHLKKDIDTDLGFRRIRESLAPLGWDIPDQSLVNSLKAAFGLDVYRSSVTELNDRLKHNRDALVRLEAALTRVVRLLRTFGVAGWGALPYAYQLVTLAALAFNDPDYLVTHQEALSRWFWRTTYAEHFTGQTGDQIKREIDLLAIAPVGADPEIARGVEIAALNALDPLRMRKVRTKAFLLFLANSPSDTDARERRRDVLAQVGLVQKDRRALARLFPNGSLLPGNVVLADSSELRNLRTEIRAGRLTDEESDAYAILLTGVQLLLPEEGFVDLRGQILIQREEEFIRSLGLSVRRGRESATSDDEDQDEDL